MELCLVREIRIRELHYGWVSLSSSPQHQQTYFVQRRTAFNLNPSTTSTFAIYNTVSFMTTELTHRSLPNSMTSTITTTTSVPTTDSHILSNIYHGLAARSNTCGYPQPNARSRRTPFPTSSYHVRPHTPHSPLAKQPLSSVPLNSLIPNQLPLKPVRPLCDASLSLRPRTISNGAKATDSLTRERKGKMPALGHLLSVEQGKVLSLAADEKHVYAGCQSEDNEITVSLYFVPF